MAKPVRRTAAPSSRARPTSTSATAEAPKSSTSRVGDLVVVEHPVVGKDETVTRRGIVVDVDRDTATVAWFAECSPVPLGQLG